LRLDSLAFAHPVASVTFSGGVSVVLAGDGDVGGLLGIHFREEMKLANLVSPSTGLN
jgi:hypothetical protein